MKMCLFPEGDLVLSVTVQVLYHLCFPLLETQLS